jgi:hypothetical protein
VSDDRRYDRIAVCQNQHGDGMYVPLDAGEPTPTSCFMECDCTPRVYVAVDALERERNA